MSSNFHLAGIIPTAGQPLGFDLPWHDSLMPISNNYLAIERAVLECAYAGCETIWIVCNDDIQPLIRHRLGDYIQDPVWSFRTFDENVASSLKPIPIYYVPVHPRDRRKRDSLGWGVLYGSYTAWKISKGMSKWLAPRRFYVAFPYGVYKVNFLREHRKKISSDNKLVLSYSGKTIKDGAYLGFTYTFEESKELSKVIWSKSRSYSTHDATNFSLQEIFEDLNIEGCETVGPTEYWEIDSWQSYTENLEEIAKNLKRPSEYILKYHEWVGIGNEIED
tara:strand:- start:2041 stop:2871 length:831 start_codon:yes stop_codon:yes gene_type:complete